MTKVDLDTTELAGRPTRERLIGVAIQLFAEQGYEGTSVGEIESAAGLVPRSGALYKHFESKRQLLGAALAERMDEIDRIDAEIDSLPPGDLRGEIRMVGVLALDELERQRDLARIVMKEGDRFPEIAADFHAAIVARGTALSMAWVRHLSAQHGVELEDPDAVGEVLITALVGRFLKTVMFGPRGAQVDREAFLAAWGELAVALLANQPNQPREDR